jgi:hypothetical protein
MNVGMLQVGTKAHPMRCVSCHTICEKWPDVMAKPGLLTSYCFPSLYPAYTPIRQPVQLNLPKLCTKGEVQNCMA